jgi:hypothetical protein
MKCVNIKSIKKSPKTKINIYSLKKQTETSNEKCKEGEYYNKKTKKCAKINVDEVRIPPFITSENKLPESSRGCVEKMLKCSNV